MPTTNVGDDRDDSSAAAADRPRRNSEQGRARRLSAAGPSDAASSPTAAAAQTSPTGRPAGSGNARRSTVKQFFDNFRPRAKSENAQSMAASPGGGKNRQVSGGGGGAPADAAGAADAAGDDTEGSDMDGGLGTIHQGEELASGVGGGGGSGSGGGGGGAKKRSRSPIGGLVNRFRLLTASSPPSPSVAGASPPESAAAAGERHRRRSGAGTGAGAFAAPLSAGAVPAHGLPHPSEMPLDCAHHEDICLDKRNRMRKAASVDEPHRDAASYPPSVGNIQERHRDLFENLSHSPDLEGQCSILSPAAVAESQARSRRMSGPLSPLAAAASPASSAANAAGRRRAQSGAPLPQAAPSTDVQVTENEKYIIFKSKCQNTDCHSATDLEEIGTESLGDPSRVFEIFTRRHRCYDLIPTSSKLLVFDNNLNVRKAFFALVYNGLRSAPLWDSGRQKFVGMLTVTDFIHILHNYYRSALVPMEELERHRISTWRAQLSGRLQPLTWISPEASLYDAVRVLLHVRVHRLPVIDPKTGNALFIVTHKRVLKFFYLYAHHLPMPAWLGRPIRELGIGTFSGIVTVAEATPLVRVLSLFVSHRVSALPVVDANGRLVDIYSKFDVINLAATKTYNNLDVTVKEALQYRRDRWEGVSSCKADDTLKSVIEQLVTAEVHRLVVTDADNRVTGLVSLSDILQALVLDYGKFQCCTGNAANSDTDTCS